MKVFRLEVNRLPITQPCSISCLAQVCQHKSACFVRCWLCWQALGMTNTPVFEIEKTWRSTDLSAILFLEPRAMNWGRGGGKGEEGLLSTQISTPPQKKNMDGDPFHRWQRGRTGKLPAQTSTNSIRHPSPAKPTPPPSRIDNVSSHFFFFLSPSSTSFPALNFKIHKGGRGSGLKFLKIEVSQQEKNVLGVF